MRKKNIQRLVIAAVLLIVLPFVISQFMLECLTKLFAMDPDQASTIASTGQVIVQALAAVMIIVQLGQDNREAKQQSEIEAARFLFQYNQSFLEDENVIEIERLIDKEYMDEIVGIALAVLNDVVGNDVVVVLLNIQRDALFGQNVLADLQNLAVRSRSSSAADGLAVQCIVVDGDRKSTRLNSSHRT